MKLKMLSGIAMCGALAAGAAQAGSVEVVSGTVNNYLNLPAPTEAGFSGSLPGLDPVTLVVEWAAQDGDGEDFVFFADVINDTGQAWTDFHLALDDEENSGSPQFIVADMGSNFDITNSVFSNGDATWDFDFVTPVAVDENLSLFGTIGIEQEDEQGSFVISLYPTVGSVVVPDPDPTPGPTPDPNVIPSPTAALAGMVGLGILGFTRRRQEA